jgi:hypothetical protein
MTQIAASSGWHMLLASNETHAAAAGHDRPLAESRQVARSGLREEEFGALLPIAYEIHCIANMLYLFRELERHLP